MSSLPLEYTKILFFRLDSPDHDLVCQPTCRLISHGSCRINSEISIFSTNYFFSIKPLTICKNSFVRLGDQEKYGV